MEQNNKLREQINGQEWKGARGRKEERQPGRQAGRQACILCMYLLIVQLVVMTAMVLLAHCLFLCWFVFLFCYKFWIAGNNYKDKTSIAIVNNSETVSTVSTCMEAIERRWRDNNTQTYCNTFKIYRPHFRSHTQSFNRVEWNTCVAMLYASMCAIVWVCSLNVSSRLCSFAECFHFSIRSLTQESTTLLWIREKQPHLKT